MTETGQGEHARRHAARLYLSFSAAPQQAWLTDEV
jgi:hypothetical protein